MVRPHNGLLGNRKIFGLFLGPMYVVHLKESPHDGLLGNNLILGFGRRPSYIQALFENQSIVYILERVKIYVTFMRESN